MSVRQRSGGARTMRFLSNNTENDELLTTDTLNIYSNDSVRELDGGFFEYFSSFDVKDFSFSPSHEDVCDSITQPSHRTGRRPTLSEALLQSFGAIESLERRELSLREKESLYAELLYTIQHKVGAEKELPCARLSIDQLIAYGQKAFDFTDEQHGKLSAVSGKAKPPILVLNVVVVEARNLEAKDADGFSDPYCMLGIIPGSRVSEIQLGDEHKDGKEKTLLRKFSASLRDSIRGKNSKEKPKQIIPAKYIQCTKVIPNSLNPTWQEKFKFDIDDVRTDKLHIDVWDHDDEESVFDAAKSLNQAKTMKGLGRVFKQIAQSARTSSGDNVDDFLGCIDIPLYDIPSTGHSEWYDLCGRSSRSKVQGQIRISLNLGTREDRGLPIEDNFNDVQQHEDLLKIFIDYERSMSDETRSADWQGLLAKQATVILHQHAVQGDITPSQEAFCYWIAFSEKFREQMFHPVCLLNILKTLEEKCADQRLSGEEEARLGKSFADFLKHFYRIMEDVRSIYPATKSDTLARLEALLECVKFMLNSDIHKQALPFADENEFNVKLTQSLKNGSRNFFTRAMASVCKATDVSTHEKLRELITLTNLMRADIKEAASCYRPIFNRVLHYPYFDPNYKLLERKLSRETRKVLEEELSSILLVTTEDVPNNSRKRASVSSVNQNGAKNLLISAVLNLYFSIQNFADARKHLKICDGTTLMIARYQDWFSRAVQEWLTLSKTKLEARIRLAVQQDKFTKVEDNFECSTSAVDVVNCYTQIAEFWQKLKWMNEEEAFAFSLKLADDICQSAVLYTDLLHSKMKKSSYFDDEGQFDVQQPLCTCLNDLEYIRRTLNELPEKLNLNQVVEAIEKHHNMESQPGGPPTHFHQVFQSLIDMARTTMEAKIEAISERVSDRMRPDIKKNVFHMCWAPEKKAIREAIEPLIDYLDQNLLTLYKYLLRRNFKIILTAIWQECLEEFQEIIRESEETSPGLFHRIQEALEILIDFFNADNKGLTITELHSSLYVKMSSFLRVQQMSTEDIITQFYKDMLSLQEEAKKVDAEVKPRLGVLGVKGLYQIAEEILAVEINYCKNIIALDSNGLSDPFIVWDLCPKHLFPDFPEAKTTIKKKTLNPVYNEQFNVEIPVELLRQEGACIRFTLMDYNFVMKDDFGGEAYLSTHDIPGVFRSTKTQLIHARPIELVFLKPQTTSENSNLMALTKRVKDAAAQQFVTNRNALAKEAQININNNDSMHQTLKHQ